jgi:hypothetical protein
MSEKMAKLPFSRVKKWHGRTFSKEKSEKEWTFWGGKSVKRLKQKIKQLFCYHFFEARTPLIPMKGKYCQYSTCVRCGKVICEVYKL